MKTNRWTVVGTATALGVSAAVATASLGGISLADSNDAGDSVVVPAATEDAAPGADVAPDASPGGDIAPDASPESADSPNESANDSPADASPESADSPNDSPAQ